MRNVLTVGIAVLALTTAACHDAEQAAPAPAARSAGSGYVLKTWPLPSTTGAAQPDLIATADGRIVLSWLSSLPGRRTALRFAALGDDGHWQSAPRTIAVGNSFVVNWADTPHITATADGAMWVHWLQRSDGAADAYDVVLSRSRDGGFNWSPPVRVNDDATATEHGFVSLWPRPGGALGVAWLDGRKTAAQAGTPGTMALRTATFSAALQRSDDAELDASVCDCCQTSVALTDRGPLLAYRDRTADEIRDIYVVRGQDGGWTAPNAVHADGWKMPACPVNGPAVAARGNHAIVAWYTAAGGERRVQLAASDDAGDHFSAPVVVDRGEAVQGRVALALDAQQAWLLWVREDAQGQSVWLARYSSDLSRELQRMPVARLTGRGRGTGFPQIAVNAGAAFLVWTDVSDGAPQLHGAVVAPAGGDAVR